MSLPDSFLLDTDALPPHPHLSIPQLVAVARSALGPAGLARLEELERARAASPPRPRGRRRPPAGPTAEARRLLSACRRLARQEAAYGPACVLLEGVLAVLEAAAADPDNTPPTPTRPRRPLGARGRRGPRPAPGQMELFAAA